jgi:PPM family protein phosphatase
MIKDVIFGKYTLGGDTRVGDPRRKHEDRIFKGEVQSASGQVYIVGIVADGVGSADSGERGAQLAIDTVVSEIQKSHDENIPDLVEWAIRKANQAVNEDNQANDGDGLTTLTVAIIHNNRCFIGNVGDSRAYWIINRDKSKMLQLTRDHNYYNMYGGDLNAEEAGVLVNAIGRKENIYVDLGFYLGGERDAPDKALRLGINGLPLKPGDSIVLCSDGLIKTDPMGERYAKDSEIIDAINTEYEPNTAAIKMVSAALGRRPDDNVSAVTIQYLTPDLVQTMKRQSVSRRNRQTLLSIGRTFLIILAIVVVVFLLLRL